MTSWSSSNMNKKTVAVLFGSRSSEHDVSCVSAMNVLSSIDKDIYDVIMIGITKEGKWLKVDCVADIKSGKWISSDISAIISPDTTHGGILFIDKDNNVTLKKIDVAFPVLHGLNGEDGTIQGLFELAHIPYVGCGVVSSGVSMDKLYTKVIVDTLGIRQAKFVAAHRADMKNVNNIVTKVEDKLEYPVFVKPSNAGSSKGVTKAHNKDELIKGIKEAFKHDSKLLVEETIVGRELECAILGGKEPIASGVGEIVATTEFYDYDAKYNDESSREDVKPKLPDGVENKIREYALNVFKSVDGFGLSRVDFFLENETNEIVFNEINTLPGFTPISMYPMLWENKGISKTQLVEKLIQLALHRFE